jgi:hypothetical protein
VTPEPVANGIQVRFGWDRLVPAAVVQRGDLVWIVFGERRLADHTAITPVFQPWLARVEQSDAANATVLRYRIRTGAHVGMARDGTVWTLTIKDTPIVPRNGLTLASRRDPIAGSQRFIPASGVGPPITLADNELGDTLVIAPISDNSAGVFETREFPDGTLLATAQGVVLAPIGPRTSLVQSATGVVLLSATSTDAEPGVASTTGALAGSTPQRFLDLAAWRQADRGRFRDVRADLLHALSMAPEPARQARRWELARFLLGHGFAPDAMGVLQRMAKVEPTLINQPHFRAARGFAALQMRRLDLASDDLGQLSLDVSPEIWLVRARLYEQLQRPQEALQAYARGADIIGTLDPAARADVQLAAIRAGLETGDLALAARELEQFPADAALAQRAEAEYLRGRLAQLQGKPGLATARFNAVQALGDRRANAQARLALVRADLATKTITPNQAIERMEQLRFAWRGDAHEQGLLFDLARLQLAQKQYRPALETLRTGTSYFRPSEQTRAMAALMDETYRTLFLTGAADALEPVQAVALFYDFRELTPLGADGDAMIRRLTERLVEVGLFDRAAGLLEHQVRYRLQGPAQAQVAARLAMIHMLANQPMKAVLAMRATRSVVVPNDVQMMRDQIEARALIDLERVDEAEALIDGDTSRVADLLRLDITWRAKDWPELIAVANRLLQPRSSDTAALSPDDVRTAMRQALAASLINDSATTTRLRTAFADRLAGSPYASAFSLLVSGGQMTPAQVDALSKTLQELDKLDSFMLAYRQAFQRIPEPVSAAAPTAPPLPGGAPVVSAGAAQRSAAAPPPPPPAG